MLSLGTGTAKHSEDTTNLNTYQAKLSLLSDLFWSSVDSEASDQNLRWALGKTNDFVRL